MQRFTAIRAMAISFSLAMGSLALAANPAEFLVFNYDLHSDNIPDASDLVGRLFVPLNYDPTQSYPLVICYHGAGEVGSNNTAQVNGNIDNLLNNAKSRGFFLYVPQTPTGWTQLQVGKTMSMAAMVMEQYNVDRKKFYVTGLSLGGGSTWTAISDYVDSLAAAVPICGVQGTVTNSRLVGVPIWAFHARDDGTVGVGTSRNQINAIRTAAGLPALVFPSTGDYFHDANQLRYTEYGSGGHGIWSTVFNTSAMYDWLLAQQKIPRTPQPGDSLYFDFGSVVVNSDSTGRVWNSTTTVTFDTLSATLPFARTSAGIRTTASLILTAKFGGQIVESISNTLYGNGIGTDGWATVGGATETTGAGHLRLSGLYPKGLYRVELFAAHSDNDAGRGRSSRYVVGNQTADLDAAMNLTQQAIFKSVAADASGKLDVAVFPTPGTNSRYGLISVLKVTALNSFPFWVDKLLAGAPEADRLASADPDKDGIWNLLEYAFGLDPLVNGSTGMPFCKTVNVGGVTYLELVFRRRHESAGVSYVVEASTNLSAAWNSENLGQPVVTEQSVTDLGGGIDEVTARYFSPVSSGDKSFLRVRVDME